MISRLRGEFRRLEIEISMQRKLSMYNIHTTAPEGIYFFSIYYILHP